MSDNLDINNTESVNSEMTNSATTSVPLVEKTISSGETNVGLTSFTPEEIASPTPSSAPRSVSQIENLAKKEVITRPLLWGVVVFLFFFALVIGAAGLYRFYQEKNGPTQEVDMLSTTPSSLDTMQSVLDTTPVSTDTTIQADAISTEIQSIDTDIEENALSDSSLGL
jgi:hypothetical protein